LKGYNLYFYKLRVLCYKKARITFKIPTVYKTNMHEKKNQYNYDSFKGRFNSLIGQSNCDS